MNIGFGREICGDFATATAREWLVTNGIGGFAAGTIAGVLTRRYHGLLFAALKPPLERKLLLTKLAETVNYAGQTYPLDANLWADGTIAPAGFEHIERFWLEGTVPVWSFACADALIEKRVWMQAGANTTYIDYRLKRATQPVTLTVKALVNYRDYHSTTQVGFWRMRIEPVARGIRIVAFPKAVPFYLLCDRGTVTPEQTWYYGYGLPVERYRGLGAREDHLHAATLQVALEPDATFTIVASTEEKPLLAGEEVLQNHQATEQQPLSAPPFVNSLPDREQPQLSQPAWINQLLLAANQFLVSRRALDRPEGKTIIAGYPWFGDWGRDTLISLPGLTLVTGQFDVARSILQTFAQFIDQGMVPNCFPDSGEPPEYNTVDATLWYFEAIRAYHAATGDTDLLAQLFPVLSEIMNWHCRGTRYQIHRDANDGLLYAGEEGVQLTWMDAKVGDWVITPRIGKPIEVNALWYNALRTMAQFAQHLDQPHQPYEQMADLAAAGFFRFWNEAAGYCFDVLDGPHGPDASLRPNQLLAISLPESPLPSALQQRIVEACGRSLLTSYGLRSLEPTHSDYQGHYGGNQAQRDGAYHQGTAWGWLLGPFALAHLRAYGDPVRALTFLEPMSNHIQTHGVGSLSEIFDGDPPFHPRGCPAQAWTVAEILRAWFAIERATAQGQ